MKFSNYILLSFCALLASCGNPLYQKGDYSFYQNNPVLSSNTPLRTDGIYVLDHITTSDTQHTSKPPKDHRFYKFYLTGQSNLFLDLDSTIKTDEDYSNEVSKDSLQKKRTLFEGYYKIEGQKIIIQGVVTPRKQFDYKYGYLENNTLVIVKASHIGKGSFDDKYFTGYYKEYYVFKPLPKLGNVVPQW